MSGSPKDSKGVAPASSTKKKVTLYFNAPMLAETQKEAIRQDRSISWIIQASWRRARDEIRKLPTAGPLVAGAADGSQADRGDGQADDGDGAADKPSRHSETD